MVLFSAELIQKNIHFELGKPCTPYEQLLSVLPPSSAHLLPKPYRSLMTDSDSPLAEFFPKSPEELLIDKEGKRFASEYVVCIPFIDANKLESALCSIKDSDLSEEEKARNMIGLATLYQYQEGAQCSVKTTLPNVFQDIEGAHVAISQAN